MSSCPSSNLFFCEVNVCSSYHLQVEQLEQDVAELRQALSDKQEQETAMLQVLFSHEVLISFLGKIGFIFSFKIYC